MTAVVVPPGLYFVVVCVLLHEVAKLICLLKGFCSSCINLCNVSLFRKSVLVSAKPKMSTDIA